MRELRLPLSLLTCFALLAVQLSGLHMHVDAYGYVGLPTGTHFHGAAGDSRVGPLAHEISDLDHPHPGNPDHEGDRDVSVELAAGASKLMSFIAPVGLGLVIVLRSGARIRIPTVLPRPKTRRDRWRPPLRAPPPLLPLNF